MGDCLFMVMFWLVKVCVLAVELSHWWHKGSMIAAVSLVAIVSWIASFSWIAEISWLQFNQFNHWRHKRTMPCLLLFKTWTSGFLLPRYLLIKADLIHIRLHLSSIISTLLKSFNNLNFNGSNSRLYTFFEFEFLQPTNLVQLNLLNKLIFHFVRHLIINNL